MPERLVGLTAPSAMKAKRCGSEPGRIRIEVQTKTFLSIGSLFLCWPVGKDKYYTILKRMPVFSCTPGFYGSCDGHPFPVRDRRIIPGVVLESSVPAGQKIPTLHHPEGINPDQMFFRETVVRNLILDYQRQANPETWQAIVTRCEKAQSGLA